MHKCLLLKIQRRYFFYIAVFFAVFSQSVIAQVSVHLELPPPFKFKVENLWKLILTNSSLNLEVYLYSTAIRLSDNRLVAEATTSSFGLPTGTKRVTASDISPVDMKKHDDNVDKTIDRFGTFPDGEYSICVYVISAEDNTELASDCADITVLTLTQPELLSPTDKEVVRDYFPVFNWLPAFPIPSGSSVTYDLVIVEIAERQTPEYALISNPPWFVQKNISNNLVRYPVCARPLNDGQRYAWKLLTYVDGVMLAESEVREFSFDNISKNVKERNDDIEQKLEKELEEIVDADDGSLYQNNISRLQSSVTEIIPDKLPSGLSEKIFYASISDKMPVTERMMFSGYFTTPYFPDEPDAFEFLTSYSAEYQYSNLQGIGSEIPRNFLNLRVDPTMLIYGVPFTFSLFYSTQQQDKLQNINSLGIFLEPGYLKKVGKEKAAEQIKKLENDVKQMQTGLENNKEKLTAEEKDRLNEEINSASDEIESIRKNPEKYLPGQQGFFSMFNTLGIGTSYPAYTKYTMNGSRVTGLNIEMNPGWFYFALSGWNNLDAIPNSSYSRNLFAGSVGVGSKDESHFHVTALKGIDDQNSLAADQVPEGLTPQENVLLGTDASLNLFDNVFALGGEVNASMFTRDVNSSEIDDIPGIVKSLTDANMSTQIDYAYEIFSDIEIKNSSTKLRGAYKYIGPGYISMGAPGIRRDVAGIDVKFNQILFNRILSLTVQFAREKNNLISQNISTSTYYKYAFNVKMNFPNAPYLIIDYRPNFVSNDLKTDSTKIENNAHVFSLMTGLNVFGDNIISSTNFIISFQNTASNTQTTDISLFNFTVSENVNFNFPLTLTGLLGFINYSPGDKTTLMLDFSTGYLFFNLWNNTLGVNYASESEISKKTGIYFNSGFQVGEIGNLYLSLQQNFYREDILMYGNRDEFILRAGISKRV